MTATPSDPTVVTLIPGDGIGPECVDAARRIIEAAGVRITWEECEAGAEVFKKGLPSGVPPETIDVDPPDARRAQGAARDPGRVRREVARTSRCASCSRPTRTSGPVREMPGVDDPVQRPRHRPRSWSGRTSRTCTPGSSTCRRPASRSA